MKGITTVPILNCCVKSWDAELEPLRHGLRLRMRSDLVVRMSVEYCVCDIISQRKKPYKLVILTLSHPS